jgi:hypothetical protein
MTPGHRHVLRFMTPGHRHTSYQTKNENAHVVKKRVSIYGTGEL